MPRVYKRKHIDQNPKVNTDLISELSETPARAVRVAEINWFALQSEEVKLEVMAKHAALLQAKRQPGQPITSDLSYSMLILATKIIHREMLALTKKKEVSQAAADEINRKRLDGFLEQKQKKGAVKRSQIKNQFFGLITFLREEKGLSWSDITLYLKRYHNFEVTRAYAQQNYDLVKMELAGKEVLNEEQLSK